MIQGLMYIVENMHVFDYIRPHLIDILLVLIQMSAIVWLTIKIVIIDVYWIISFIINLYSLSHALENVFITKLKSTLS